MIVGACAPSDWKNDYVKKEFYDLLRNVVDQTTNRKELFLVGNFNVRVENNTIKIVGLHGEDQVNGNGKQLINFCASTQLQIMNTLFPHK